MERVVGLLLIFGFISAVPTDGDQFSDSKLAVESSDFDPTLVDHDIVGVHVHGENLEFRSEDISSEEERAREFLKLYETLAVNECRRSSIAEWQYATDITPQNKDLKLASATESARFEKESWTNATSFNWREFKDEKLKRQFKQLSILGTAALPKEKLEEYNKIQTNMETIYSSAKICDSKSTNCSLSLEPEINQIMAKSRDYDELEHVWTQWHDLSGGKMRDLYPKFVEISNEAARLNNYSDTVAMWMYVYESDTFREDVEALWQNLKPLYMQLHAYMRHRLSLIYGPDRVKLDEPIPAHILGNMWAQTWNNLLDDTVPYPGLPSVDVTGEMNAQGYTPKKMFEVAEGFFTSLGLKPMTPEFWQNSVIEKPTDGRDMVCHASAWDFCDGKDTRIKQCTRINKEDIITVHHEMGHIQYYLQYKDQPKIFRTGANPGFHEAVGDTLALSASTPKHLSAIGLLKNYSRSRESELNSLFAFATEKVAFIPFAYLMDKWRWDVFEGKVKPEEYNCHWWKLREEYQGVQAPKPRPADKFDPGAKYHIAANVEYLRYFVSLVLQFQFHKALCIEAGEYNPDDPAANPLHNCDIYKSTKAGTRMAAMLSLGASVPWPEVLEVGTGTRKMDTGAFREYFAPLEKWLEEENKKNGVEIGWKTGDNRCPTHETAEPEPAPEPEPEPEPKSGTIGQKIDAAKDSVKDFFGKVAEKASEVKESIKKGSSSATSVYSSAALVLLAVLRAI